VQLTEQHNEPKAGWSIKKITVSPPDACSGQ